MSYINDYKVMDVFNAIDDHTGEMLIPARIFVGSSFDGGDPDYGQCQQRVINTDDISYVYHIPDPRMEWPAQPGFGVHKNSGEIGVIIKGQFEISYPDGNKKLLNPGDFFVNEKGQPYRFVGADDEPGGAYIVFHGIRDQKIGNEPSQEKGTGYRTGSIEQQPTIENLPDYFRNITIKNIGTSDGVTVLKVILGKGAALPFDGWTVALVPEIAVVISGELAGIYPDKTYTVTEKYAFYNNVEQPHKYINIGEEDAVLIIALKAESIEKAGFSFAETTDYV